MSPSAVESWPRRGTGGDRGTREASSRLPLGEERANILLVACCYQEGSAAGSTARGVASPYDPVQGLNLFERHAVLVFGEPRFKCPQRRVQSARGLKTARAAEILLEIAIELEHIAQILGSRETKAAVDVRRHIVVAHLLTQRPGERGGHLRTG